MEIERVMSQVDVFEQDTEPQVAPDGQATKLHGLPYERPILKLFVGGGRKAL